MGVPDGFLRAAGEIYERMGDFQAALEDFRQSNTLLPAHNLILAGLAITYHMLEQNEEAKRIWRALLAQDQRYRDADWVGQELNWTQPLIEAARKLIIEL